MMIKGSITPVMVFIQYCWPSCAISRANGLLFLWNLAEWNMTGNQKMMSRNKLPNYRAHTL